jgi:transposase InsO family protein
VHRSTYYYWTRQVDRHGLEVLGPRERRRPQMPNRLPRMIEERILSFSIAHPGFGPRRIASELAREKWGGIVASPNGVWKVLCRHGLKTRAKRLGLIAGYAAPYEPPRDPGPEQHIDVERPRELVGIDCFYVGRLRRTNGAVWQLTAIDIASSCAWAELVVRKQGNPTAAETSRAAQRVARDLQAAGWKLERVLTDTGNEFRGEAFPETLKRLGTAHTRIHAGRPQTNGHVEALHKTILDECWRPRVRPRHLPRLHRTTARTRHLPALLQPRPRPPRTPHPRTHPRRHRLRCSPRWRRDEPHLSAHLGVGPALSPRAFFADLFISGEPKSAKNVENTQPYGAQPALRWPPDAIAPPITSLRAISSVG